MPAPLRPTIIVIDPIQRLRSTLATQPELAGVQVLAPRTATDEQQPAPAALRRLLCRYPHAPVLLDLVEPVLSVLPLLMVLRDCPCTPRRAVRLVRPVGVFGVAWPLQLMATEAPHPRFGWTRLVADL